MEAIEEVIARLIIKTQKEIDDKLEQWKYWAQDSKYSPQHYDCFLARVPELAMNIQQYKDLLDRIKCVRERDR
jgi:hypothetical protein